MLGRRGFKCLGRVAAIDMIPPFGLWITRPEGADFGQTNPLPKKACIGSNFRGVSVLRETLIFRGFAGTPARLIGGFCVSRGRFLQTKLRERRGRISCRASAQPAENLLIRRES